MTDSKDAWDKAGDSFEPQLREHYRRAGAQRGSTGDVDDALRRLGDAVDAAVTAVGDAVRNPAFQESAKGAGRALADALAATFERVGEHVGVPARGRAERREEGDRSDPS